MFFVLRRKEVGGEKHLKRQKHCLHSNCISANFDLLYLALYGIN